MRLFLASTLSLSFLFLPACGDDGGGTTAGGTDTSSTTEGTGTDTTASTTSPTSDGPGSNSNTDSGSTTADPTTGPGTTTTTGPDTTTTETSTTTTTETSTTADTTTTDTTTDTTTGTTGGPLQCPPEPGDDACDMCVKENCCEELVACGGNEDCVCFFGCLGMGIPGQVCAQMCQIQMPGQVPEIADIFECTSGNNGACGQVCQ